MMQVLPKWKVTARFVNRDDVVLWLSDLFLCNVLRKVGDIQFADGMEQPVEIRIEAVSMSNQAV